MELINWLLAAATGWSSLPLLVVLSSFVPGICIMFLREDQRRLRTLLNLSGAVLKVILVGVMLAGVAAGVEYRWSFVVLPGFELALVGDSLALLFVTLSAGLWLVTTVYAIGYLEGSPNRTRFFSFFSLCVTATTGLAMAGDLFTFVVFYEALTWTTYPLIVHRGTAAALRAGRIYLAYTLTAGAFLLVGAVGLHVLAGSVEFQAGGMLDPDAVAGARGRYTLVFLLLLAGLGVKTAFFPLHGWLPAAMIAPAPVSALLHAVAVVKAGAFGVLRLLHSVFGIELATAASALLSGAMIKGGLLAWIRYLPPDGGLAVVGSALVALGAAAALYGVIVGLTQVDAKTVLAYSSVSQMGFMAIGVGLMARASEAGPVALLAVVAYAVHHGVAKGALFLSVGVADRMGGPGAPESGQGASPTRASRAIVLGGAALPALALGGAPLSMGAQSKGALKAAISELGPELYSLLDPLLLLAGAGTTVLMVRFLMVLAGRMAHEAETGEHSAARRSGWPVGILVPWAGLLAAGLAGPWWLPGLLPTTWVSMLPGASYAWLGSAAPVAVAAAIAMVVARRPTLLGKIRDVSVPPGDILLPLERWGSHVARWSRHGPGLRFRRRTPSVRTAAPRVGSWIAALARMDLRLAAGRYVAPMLLVLVLLALATLLL